MDLNKHFDQGFNLCDAVHCQASYTFIALIADNGGSVKEVQHDRILLTAFVYKVALICTVETRGGDHAELIKSRLEDKYKKDLTWHTAAAHHYEHEE